MSEMRRDPVRSIERDDAWLVVVAHPDDETFGCGSLIADASRRGASVTVVCATRGEAGERTAVIDPDANLAEVRTAELYAAAAVLGAASVELLDYADSGFDGPPPADSLCGADVDRVADEIGRLVDRLQPTVIAVLDASDGHRDHERVRVATRNAVASRAADAATPPVVVEVALPNRLMRQWLDEMRRVQPDAPYLSIDPAVFGTPDDTITDSLDHSDVLHLREQAIALHRSQQSPFDELSPALRRAFLDHTHLVRAAVL